MQILHQSFTEVTRYDGRGPTRRRGIRKEGGGVEVIMKMAIKRNKILFWFYCSPPLKVGEKQ